MPQKSGRAFILIACACAVFWPGAFIFGYPGIMRHYWQQAFNVGGSFVIWLSVWQPQSCRRYLPLFCRAGAMRRPTWCLAVRLYSGFHPGQLHPCLFLPWPHVSGFGRTHPAGSALARMPVSSIKDGRPEWENQEEVPEKNSCFRPGAMLLKIH